MKTKTKRIMILTLSLFLAFCLPFGVIAVKNAKQPKSSSGGYYSDTVNRVDFSVTNTDFILVKAGTGTETFSLKSEITVKKCETDFYAKIKSMQISGDNVRSTVFISRESSDTYFPENPILRDANSHTWDVEITFDALSKSQTPLKLIIEYESGITFDTSDTHRLTVPLNVTVN